MTHTRWLALLLVAACATTPPTPPPQLETVAQEEEGVEETREATFADDGLAWGMTPLEVLTEWSEYSLQPDVETKAVCATCSSLITGQKVRDYETLVGFSFCTCAGNSAEACLFSTWHVYRGDNAANFLLLSRDDVALVYPNSGSSPDVWAAGDSFVSMRTPVSNVALVVFAASEQVCESLPTFDTPEAARTNPQSTLSWGSKIALLQTPEGRVAEAILPGISKDKTKAKKKSSK